MDTLDAILARARSLRRRIALPEATDPRVLVAARRLVDDAIATPVLVGARDAVSDAAGRADVSIADLELVSPADLERRDLWIERIEPRFSGKGVTRDELAAMLADPLYAAAAMVACDEADGSVAGATHTTSETLKAALRVLRPAEDARIVSSFFLMQLARPTPGGEPVLAFADAGLVPDPDPAQLADIAIRTAANFRSLTGREPRVALLSFSTRGSAAHPAVEKVLATRSILRAADVDFAFDGELQVDAAIVPEVARSKAPDGPLDGRANVLVFPDLDAGNIGYKLVQRLAGAIAVGPITQGLSRPANDLSRGCSTEDVVLVAAITAIQSAAEREAPLP